MFGVARRRSRSDLFFSPSRHAPHLRAVGLERSHPLSGVEPLAGQAHRPGCVRSITPHLLKVLIQARKPLRFSATAAASFRITYDPPVPQEFTVSDGVKEVDSAEGLLEYGTTPSFRVGAEDLPQLCPQPTRASRTTVLGRAADRYTCKPAGGEQFSEVTLDSGNS